MRSGADWARAGVPAEAASIRRIMYGRCSRLLAAIGPQCGDRSCIALAAVLARGYRHFVRLPNLCEGMRMVDLVLRGGRVIDPASGRDETADIAFGDGK